MSEYKVGRGKPPLDSQFKRGNQEWRKREAKRKARAEFSPGNDGAVAFCVGIRCGAISRDMRLSSQAARSIG